MFRQIRMYDTECIGLEEFNDWWNSNQRKEVRLGNGRGLGAILLRLCEGVPKSRAQGGSGEGRKRQWEGRGKK